MCSYSFTKGKRSLCNHFLKDYKILDKNKKIPNTLSKAIEDINKKITDVVYSTNGRLNGIVIDEIITSPIINRPIKLQ